VAGSVANSERIGKPLPHWQVCEATITADPPQPVTGDGELWEPTPLTVSVIPGGVQILVPDSDNVSGE
jgi:diacylglycerol kinase family enzyme